MTTVKQFEKLKRWYVFALWPICFYFFALLVDLMNSDLELEWLGKLLDAVTSAVPHLKMLKMFAYDGSFFDLIMSLSIVSGVFLGIQLSYRMLPLLLHKSKNERGAFIRKHKKFYPTLIVFSLFGSWMILFEGPESYGELTRFSRVVAQSNIGIATYGVMYYFASSVMIVCMTSLVAMAPMHVRYYLNLE